MLKKIKCCIIISIILLIFCNIIYVPKLQGATTYWEEEEMAEKLAVLGLFSGTGNGFELDRVPTRAEAAVMFVRLLGKEKEAIENKYNHNFTDVPDWANNYVGFMSEYKLTSGVGNNEFGSSLPANANMYMTFILRALDYDEQQGDFQWDKAVNKAVDLEIISNFQKNYLKEFTRGDLAALSYKALEANIKDTEKPLLIDLIETDAFTKETAKEVGLDYLITYYEVKDGLTTIKSSNYEDDYFEISLEGSNTVRLEGKTLTDNKWVWLRVNSVSNIQDQHIPVNNKTYSKVFNISLEEGKEYELEIFMGEERYGTYSGFAKNIILTKNKTGLVIKPSPVYFTNLFKEGNEIPTKEDVEFDINFTKTWIGESNYNKITDLALEITKGIDNDYEKVLAVHDWVADNIYYDYDAYYSGSYDDNRIKGSLLDALNDKRSVCQGYAELTEMLLLSLDIPCVVVKGYALGMSTTGRWEGVDELDTNHAWNEVYVDGRWIIMDTTWDSRNKYEDGQYIRSEKRYRFFDPTIEAFSFTHRKR
ncbi:MAG: transglutaminase domain-containing protein [Eubacteriales bacterium]